MLHWDPRILAYWAAQMQVETSMLEQSRFVLRYDPELNESVIYNRIGAAQIIILPACHQAMLEEAAMPQSLEELTARLGIMLTLRGRDFIYYATTPVEAPHILYRIQPLTAQDTTSLDALKAQCTPDELSLALVGMDDLRVTGCFDGDQLVGAASLLEKTPDIYDIGVLTHPAYRGQQIGVALTLYLRNALTLEGKIAQYVTMQSNHGSVRVAEKSQFTLFVVEETYKITPA